MASCRHLWVGVGPAQVARVQAEVACGEICRSWEGRTPLTACLDRPHSASLLCQSCRAAPSPLAQEAAGSRTASPETFSPIQIRPLFVLMWKERLSQEPEDGGCSDVGGFPVGPDGDQNAAEVGFGSSQLVLGV